jgi:hypothetical protein
LPKVKIIKVTFSPQSFTPPDIPRLRAFLAKQFPEYSELHNHLVNGGFRMVYPDIQFKFIENRPMIVGYGKGLQILTEVFQKVNYFDLNHRRVDIPEKSIQIVETQIGESGEMYRYSFLTPWMALNQDNYFVYQHLDFIEREVKLNRILWGNLRALAHAFGYWIPDPNKVDVRGDFNIRTGKFKGKTMLTFSGEFSVNFHIPDYLGLGKQTARGYGTVVKSEDKRQNTKEKTISYAGF